MDLANLAATAGQLFKILLPTLLLIGIFLTWMAWVIGVGRFQRRPLDVNSRETTIRYMVVKFFVEIINDFKHILAILLTFMFVGALFSVIYFALVTQKNFALFKDGLQVVVASLGGLIGSIVGYYFGESAASRRLFGQAPLDTSGREEVQVGLDDKLPEASRPPDLTDMNPAADGNNQTREGE